MTRVLVIGSTRLSRVALPWLLETGRARVIGLDPGDEDESRPFFAPLRGLVRELGIPLGRAPADLVLDLDPDARPTRGEGPMVRVLAPPGAPSPDLNRALLTGGSWAMGLTTAAGDGLHAAATVEVRVDDDASTLMDRALLRGLEVLAAGWDALLAATPPTPLPAPLLAGRWRAQESEVHWEQEGARVVARIRAAAGPWGGAVSTLGEARVRLLDAELAPIGHHRELPGTVLDLRDGLLVAARTDAVRIRRVAPGWRPARLAVEYAAEVGLSPGYTFV